MAITEPSAGSDSAGRAGIRAFVVDAGAPGMFVTKVEEKLGIRASDTATIVLEDCEIPLDDILHCRSGVDLVSVFQYFSTITLTTVGYGGIVPVMPAARLVTGLQAITGQIYLAVVVATLVGRVGARRD
jgi:alkylation response protein AidB-like acyl-CoA dehydrogenase